MSTSSMAQTGQTKRDFYFSMWRWHFYAGLFVIPFLTTLAITGLAMLYQPSIESYLHSDKIYVEPQQTVLSHESQKETVLQYYAGKITTFIPPKANDLSSQFQVTTETGESLKVYINPYTGEVLGDLSNDNNLYTWANDIHGTLLIGDFGDWLMELAACFTILLTITGLYLWWPRKEKSQSNSQALKAALTPRTNKGSRVLWRDLHAIIGTLMVVFLLFFCLTGLSWSGVWGSKLTQAWNTFPVGTWGSGPYKSEANTALYNNPNQDTHSSLNHGVMEEMPWNLEQAQIPVSGTKYGENGIPQGLPINLDTVTSLANSIGFTTYRVSLPRGETGVYTISANTMSGDIKEPTQDRTMHIDQYSGKILADFGYNEYNLVAKSMAYGVALHSGYMYKWNIALNTVACLAVIFICISGAVMWWKRRPANTTGLVAPPMPKNLARWKQASILMLVLSFFLPLALVCMVSLLVIDSISARYLPRIKQIYQ